METLSLQDSIDEKKSSSQKLLLWVGMGSMVMLFAGLTSAYIVRRMEGNWQAFELPPAFYISTAIIILSSVTLNMALSYARNNNLTRLNQFLLLTLLLGFAFIVSQFMGYSKLVEQGTYLVGNPSGSFLFVLTGLHIAHLVGGIIALIVVNIKTRMKKYNSQNTLGIELSASYWHFLDILWIYLFLFLLFIH